MQMASGYVYNKSGQLKRKLKIIRMENLTEELIVITKPPVKLDAQWQIYLHT